MFKKISPEYKKEYNELSIWYKDKSKRIRDALNCQNTFEGLKEYKEKFKELNKEYIIKIAQLKQKYRNI